MDDVLELCAQVGIALEVVPGETEPGLKMKPEPVPALKAAVKRFKWHIIIALLEPQLQAGIDWLWEAEQRGRAMTSQYREMFDKWLSRLCACEIASDRVLQEMS